VDLAEARLVIEEIDVGGAAVLEKVDDPFCFGGLVRKPRRAPRIRFRREQSLFRKQRSEGCGPDPRGGAAEKLPTVDPELMLAKRSWCTRIKEAKRAGGGMGRHRKVPWNRRAER
jgi:hypothetical protein